jgi:hypothetical protein
VSWPDLADGVLVATRDLFGEVATYTAIGASPLTISAIFDDDAVIVSQELGVPVRSGRPGVGVRLADLGVAPILGAEVSVRGMDFTVADVVRDGHGGAVLLLHRL